MKLTILLIDDDLWSSKRLLKLFNNYFLDITVISDLKYTNTTNENIQEVQIDILLFNIDIGPKELKFILKDIYPSKPYIILIYNTPIYTFSPTNFEITSYLLKPISLDELSVAINLVKNRLTKDLFYEKNNGSNSKSKFIGFTELGNIMVIQTDDILFLKSQKNETYFHLSNGQVKKSNKRIGEYEKILPPNIFIRVHRQYIVNMSHTSRIIYDKNMNILFDLSTYKVPVSFRKHKLVLNFLKI